MIEPISLPDLELAGGIFQRRLIGMFACVVVLVLSFALWGQASAASSSDTDPEGNLFVNGATHITTTLRLAKFPQAKTFGAPSGLYVTPHCEVNNLITVSASRRELESGLGLDQGALQGGELVRVDIDNPCLRKLRFPAKGNKHFRPGSGLTTGDLHEALIDSPPKSDPHVHQKPVQGL